MHGRVRNRLLVDDIEGRGDPGDLPGHALGLAVDLEDVATDPPIAHHVDLVPVHDRGLDVVPAGPGRRLCDGVLVLQPKIVEGLFEGRARGEVRHGGNDECVGHSSLDDLTLDPVEYGLPEVFQEPPDRPVEPQDVSFVDGEELTLARGDRLQFRLLDRNRDTLLRK